MLLDFDEIPSNSPFVVRIWHNRSQQSGEFYSLALTHWSFCFWRKDGQTTATIRGPESHATLAEVPADAEFTGVYFKLGTYLCCLPAGDLVDSAIHLPNASGQSFWLCGSAWQFPQPDQVETFVDRLVRAGVLLQEPLVAAARQGEPIDLSLRSLQRRFRFAAGLTSTTVHQIERARYAAVRLLEGAPILDVVDEAGYADQPHLTRSLRLFTGQTPAQLSSRLWAGRLSFLFKTANVFPAMLNTSK